MNNPQNEEVIKKCQPKTQQRYREIYEYDDSMFVRKLMTGTTKYFIRERTILQNLPPHMNVIKLVEVCNQPFPASSGKTDKFTEYLIFEFAEHEIESLISSNIAYGEMHLKCVLKQILQGIGHIHHHGIIHRDLKPANIVQNKHGEIKIIDFGQARSQDLSYLD